MKSTSIILATIGIALLAGAILIAQRSASGVAPPAAHGPEPWSFKAGRGVTLSDAARKALGIETLAVESGALAPEHRGFSAQVFRKAAESPTGRDAGASVWLPAAEAAHIAVGQTVRLARGDTPFTARVTAIKTSTPGELHNAELLLDVADPSGALRVGDFLPASLSEDPRPRTQASVVPASAVVDSIRGQFVYAVNSGAFLRTPVKLGARQGGKVEVLDGLFEGDEIVSSGASDLWLVELQAVNGGKGCADGH